MSICCHGAPLRRCTICKAEQARPKRKHTSCYIAKAVLERMAKLSDKTGVPKNKLFEIALGIGLAKLEQEQEAPSAKPL